MSYELLDVLSQNPAATVAVPQLFFVNKDIRFMRTADNTIVSTMDAIMELEPDEVVPRGHVVVKCYLDSWFQQLDAVDVDQKYTQIVQSTLDRLYQKCAVSAAKLGDLKTVQACIARIAMRNPKDLDNVLATASEFGHVNIVRLFIDHGADTCDFDGGMIRAAYGGHLDIVKMFIKRGAKKLDSAMRSAAMGGHVDIVKWFLYHPDAHMFKINSVLQFVTNTDIAEMLIEHRYMVLSKAVMAASSLADFTAIKDAQQSFKLEVDFALSNEAIASNADHVKLLIRHGAKPSVSAVVRGGDIGIVKLMIELGANDWDDAMGRAASTGHMNIVKLMIEHGADDWNHAMATAASFGHTDIVKLMIEHGADCWNDVIRQVDVSIDIVKLMIEHGADNWNDIMMAAVACGDIDIVKLAIQRGVAGLNDAMTAAGAYGHIDIVKLMIQHGADDWNRTMDLAAPWGYIDIVKLMIEHGADNLNAVMVSAAERGHHDIVKLMLYHGADAWNEAMSKASKCSHVHSLAMIKTLIHHSYMDR